MNGNGATNSAYESVFPQGWHNSTLGGKWWKGKLEFSHLGFL